MSITYAERLRQQDAAFDTAPMAGNTSLPPAGEYQAIVDRFDVFEAKTNGRLYLKTEMRVQVPDQFRGWTIDTLHDLEDPDPKRMGKLKAHLFALEITPNSLATLEADLEKALDAIVLVKVTEFEKDNKEIARAAWVNQTVGRADPQKALAPDGAGVAAQVAAMDPEDIPFVWRPVESRGHETNYSPFG